MKISKLLAMILGMAGFFRMGIVEDGGGGGASSQESLVDSFASFFSGDQGQAESGAQQQAQQQAESPEAAAERLAAEEAAAANQNNAGEGEKQNGAQAEEEKFTIPVDGKDVSLTKAELAEHYKNGLRQQDYTRKTMEAAEQRKAADAEIAKTQAERNKYAQQLQNYLITSDSILAEQAKVLTDELLREDPVEYLAQQRTFQERQANAARAQQELQQIMTQQQQEHADAVKAYQAEQLEKLQAKLPEWKDPAKATAERERVKNYLKGGDFGFSDAELASLGDHRFVLMADKAQKYDALIARAKETAGKVQKAPPKVERPGTPTQAPDGRSSAMRELARTGSRDAAAKAFAEMFG